MMAEAIISHNSLMAGLFPKTFISISSNICPDCRELMSPSSPVSPVRFGSFLLSSVSIVLEGSSAGSFLPLSKSLDLGGLAMSPVSCKELSPATNIRESKVSLKFSS